MREIDIFLKSSIIVGHVTCSLIIWPSANIHTGHGKNVFNFVSFQSSAQEIATMQEFVTPVQEYVHAILEDTDKIAQVNTESKDFKENNRYC